jgi:uncharacterized phage protein (TIGR02216 family)
MEVGLGKLGLTPDQFWAMSPIELRTMAHGRFGKPQQPLTRDWLNAMIEKDRKQNGR